MAASTSVRGPGAGHPTPMRPGPAAENWDEDFDFVLPKRAARSASRASPQPVEVVKEANVPDVREQLRPKRASSPVEDWDAELLEAGPSYSATGGSASSVPDASTQSALSQSTSSVANSLSGLRLSSPISSQPHPCSISTEEISLPTGRGDTRANGGLPLDNAAWSRRVLADDPSFDDTAMPFSRSYQAFDTTVHEGPAHATVHKIYPPNALHSSPVKTLHHSRSTEQMPPPPAPVSASASQRMSSRSSSRATLKEETNSAGDGALEVDKKPGFWKRLSGNPGGPSRPSGSRTASHHRRRSSAFLPTRSPAPDLPPVPPVPSSMRSTSGTSAVSAGSALSQGSSTASTSAGRDQTRSGLASLSGMLRRSSSRLSQAPRVSAAPPIPSSPSVAGRSQGGPSAWSRSSSASSRGPIPAIPSLTEAATEPSPRLASSASFSRGFHLPSPSPQSPYNHSDTGLAPQPKLRSLPRSPSFPTRPTMGAEGLGILPLNEKSAQHRKARPVSAVLSQRPPSQRDPATSGPFEPPSFAQIPPPSAYTPSSLPPTPEKATTLDANGLPRSPSMAKSSTFRRLASASRKHGRRISGGWRFGSAPSSPAAEVRRAEMAQPIVGSQPAVGDPSAVAEEALPDIQAPALHRAHGQSEERSNGLREMNSHAMRAGLSRENSETQGGPTTAVVTEDSPSERPDPVTEQTPVDRPKSSTRRRRRSSYGDFVIPREVLEKQKGVKRGIGAVKQFAAGVESLKALEKSHATAQRQWSARTGNRNHELASLERDYAQYWEMASVLIELASTGQDDPAEHAGDSHNKTADLSGKSGQSRRQGTASAKPNGQVKGAPSSKTSRVLSSSSADWAVDSDFSAGAAPKAIGLRTSSLPEPDRSAAAILDSSQGPPRADLELWHASTGRHDLSKRQLEVLRTMLSSPISKDELLRSNLDRPPEPRRRETAPQMSKTFAQSAPNTPNTGDRLYAPSQPARGTPIQPSVAFSDSRRTVAETQSQASRASASAAKRRASRSGLGGFKDFIRNLGKDKGHDASTPSRSQSMAHLALGSDAAVGMTRSKSEAVMPAHAEIVPPLADEDTARDSAGLPKSRSRRTGLGLGWPEESPSALDAHRPPPQDSDTKEVVLALTPENLPVLLQYLRQCESKLREWETKADKILGQDAN